MEEKAPAQIATTCKHATTIISNVPLWHCCQESFRNPGVKKFGFFSQIGNWHKHNPEVILYSSFSFHVLGFSHKAQQTWDALQPSSSSSTTWEQRGGKGEFPLSANMPERVPSVGGSLWWEFVLPHSCNPAPHSGSQSQAGHLTVGGSPPGPLFCPASRAGWAQRVGGHPWHPTEL